MYRTYATDLCIGPMHRTSESDLPKLKIASKHCNFWQILQNF
jgi:hypothetical protein